MSAVVHNLSDSTSAFFLSSVLTVLGAAGATALAAQVGAWMFKPAQVLALYHLLTPLAERPELEAQLDPLRAVTVVANYDARVRMQGRELVRADWDHMQNIAAAFYAARRIQPEHIRVGDLEMQPA